MKTEKQIRFLKFARERYLPVLVETWQGDRKGAVIQTGRDGFLLAEDIMWIKESARMTPIAYDDVTWLGLDLPNSDSERESMA